MKYEDFFKLVTINDEDKAKAIHYLNVRGISEHIFVANYLQSLKSDKVTYAEVATAFRYDKRIRRIIYKYIGFLEEYMRAYIVNTYEGKIHTLCMTNTLVGLLNKHKTFYEAVGDLTFGNLMHQIKKLSDKEKAELFRGKYIATNLDAIVELRNAVNHNRFLLHNKSLKACKLEETKVYSLWANIMNLANHLPEKMAESFVEEISAAKIPGKVNYEHQTDWQLNQDIIINIDIQKANNAD